MARRDKGNNRQQNHSLERRKRRNDISIAISIKYYTEKEVL